MTNDVETEVDGANDLSMGAGAPKIVVTAEMTNDQFIEEKILHILRIYPKLSSSMLQVAIGTGLSPQLWHPVFEKMVLNGTLEKRQIIETTPKGRNQTYTIISIAP